METTRSKDGKMGRIQDGVGMIASRTKVPLIPVGIRGTFDALPRHRKWPKFKKIIVRYGPEVKYSDLDLDNADRNVYKEIARRLSAAIRRLTED